MNMGVRTQVPSNLPWKEVPAMIWATAALLLLSTVYCLLLMSTCGHTLSAVQLLSTPYVHRERCKTNTEAAPPHTHSYQLSCTCFAFCCQQHDHQDRTWLHHLQAAGNCQ